MDSVRTQIDPASTEHVTRALTDYLGQRRDLTGLRLAGAPAPVGNGFDSFIYGFRIDCETSDRRWLAPLVLRLQRKPEYAPKARREADVQAFMAQAGYPTPALLAVEDESNAFGLPFAIMERVPGTTMLARVMSNPLRASGLLRQLGELHARMHRLPTDGWRFDEGSEPITLVRLARTRQGVEQLQLLRFEDRLVWLERNTNMVLPETAAITHNDFHPLNVLVTPDGQLSVIDWDDAAVGDRHFDVARTVTLFSFAYIAASSTLERVILKSVRGFLRSRYLKGYAAEFSFDPRRLAYFEALQSMYALVQLYELQAEPASEDVTAAASRMLRGLPDLIAEAEVYVQRRIDDAQRALAH
jgi:aminoglycoside phosphotransferase (APT) family kinase protein